ncbi:MAG: redoxin domain-containing protein [Candidatus Eremiobacteraeota bacterium]|nr:redoxin domain-containing protein [Candidatus Eremiobacteraeota bacterium]
MRRVVFSSILSAAALAVAATVASAAEPQKPAQAGPEALTGPQVGQPAPPFSLRTLDGRTVTLDSFRGKTLVLNVWATWCPPCRQETPDLLRAYASLHGPSVAFLGVDDTEKAPIVRAFVAAKQVPYPQAIDSNNSFSKAYDIRAFPTTFVIDPQGIIRVRNIDVATPDTLRSFITAAASGQNFSVSSPQQQKIDALLTQPIALDGDRAAVLAGVKQVNDAIDKAEQLVNDGDPAKGTATDFLRTKAEEAALRDRAIAALAKVASTDEDKGLLARLRGDSARDREQWSDALALYDQALAMNPKDEDALSGVSFVAAPLKQYARAADADARIVALHPDVVDPLLDLVVDQAAARQFAQAEATATKANALAMSQLAAKPNDVAKTRKVASTHLVAGRVYVKAGDAAKARAEFDQLIAWASKLPKSDDRYAMYLEEAQEAKVALDLSGPQAATRVSLTPWTGADLPGSIPNTVKYRLVVAGRPGRSIDLHTADVPKGWVASFCTDRVCSPFKVSVALPSSGVKVIEFQLVPPDTKTAATPKVRVIGTDGAQKTIATT